MRHAIFMAVKKIRNTEENRSAFKLLLRCASVVSAFNFFAQNPKPLGQDCVVITIGSIMSHMAVGMNETLLQGTK